MSRRWWPMSFNINNKKIRSRRKKLSFRKLWIPRVRQFAGRIWKLFMIVKTIQVLRKMSRWGHLNSHYQLRRSTRNLPLVARLLCRQFFSKIVSQRIWINTITCRSCGQKVEAIETSMSAIRPHNLHSKVSCKLSTQVARMTTHLIQHISNTTCCHRAPLENGGKHREKRVLKVNHQLLRKEQISFHLRSPREDSIHQRKNS